MEENRETLPVQFVYVEDGKEMGFLAEKERQNYIDELNRKLWNR